ncbi:hypothetical protein HX805_08935 [Pseudomonas sp. G5001]|uniref:hypothetical protein n=1 Tax=Pseudomonas sp. G5001 TaxID=2738824 RepID=UPI0015A1F825|nr:hypothetical protein [Pseudomonas sp. G5001]NWB72590.1 hypothetical protein [Pseudomonas sp. G5001]
MDAATIGHPRYRQGVSKIYAACVRLEEIAKQFEAHGITINLDAAMIKAMKSSSSQRYINHNRAVHSPIERNTIKCWVFEALPRIETNVGYQA